jgi:hypothetical protein
LTLAGINHWPWGSILLRGRCSALNVVNDKYEEGSDMKKFATLALALVAIGCAPAPTPKPAPAPVTPAAHMPAEKPAEKAAGEMPADKPETPAEKPETPAATPEAAAEKPKE